MSWGTVLSLVGIGASIWGSSQSASAATNQANAQAASIAETAAHNASISRYDAAVTRREGEEYWYKTNKELEQHREAGDRFLSTQRSRFAKSGVAVDTGTPLETMARTEDEFIADEKMIAYEGLKDIQTAESLATRYDHLATFGLRDAAAQATLVAQAGQDRSNAAWISGITQASSIAYDWWSES